ncbi:MAG: oligosaccharide flippase family protein [Patescibacteria group bacterium]
MIANFKTSLAGRLKKTGQKFNLDLAYFVKNSFWASLKQIIETFSGLIFYVLFARLASQEIFGQYQLFLSILAVASIFSVPGLNTALIRSAAKGYDGDYKRVPKISFSWSLLGIPALILIGLFYLTFQKNPQIAQALLLTSVFFPLLYTFRFWESFLHGKGAFKKAAQFSAFFSLSINALLITMAFCFKNKLLPIVLAYLLAHTLLNLILTKKSQSLKKNNKQDKESIKYGYFLTKLNILGNIANNIDKLLVGTFLSPAQLAVYSVGTLFTRQVQGVSKNIMGITIPKYIKHKKLPRSIYLKIFAASVVFTVLLLVAFHYGIPLLFKEKYADSIFLSKISIIFFPFFVLSSLYRNQFLFTNKKVIAGESIIFQILKIASSLLILPFWGIEGLAFILGFQYVIVTINLFVLGKIFKEES